MKNKENKKMRKTVITIALIMLILSIGCITGQSKKVSSCEANAIRMMPNPIELKFAGENEFKMLENTKWNDGTEMKCPICYYRIGPEGGEDALYHLVSQTGLKYAKQIRSEDRKTLGTRIFIMKPVLKPILGSERNILDKHGWTEEVVKFETVEYNIAECNWAE